MILNDFQCKDCDSINEHRYKYENRDKLICPECGSENLQLLLSAPALRTLDSREKISHALKKRTVEDHNKNKADRLERAKAKNPEVF
tara:strand:- start:7 stop:267 length:261 start_codon:yes stop_codon:yes gene_type:complete